MVAQLITGILLLPMAHSLRLQETYVSSSLETKPEVAKQDPIAFLDLHSFLIQSEYPDRMEEYCVTLHRNIENVLVSSVRLYTLLSKEHAKTLLEKTCKLTMHMLKKINLTDVSKKTLSANKSEDSLSVLTYKTLFEGARHSAAKSKLQVIMHSDIVLGAGWQGVQSCLSKILEDNVAFHLARMEPDTCFPLLNGEAREQTVRWAADNSTYRNICQSNNAAFSHDAFAFGGNVSDAVLKDLDFVPNRLGAENVLSCRMARAGFKLQNPCSQLQILHNHCSDHRSYSEARVDDVDGCANFQVLKPTTEKQDVCKVAAEPSRAMPGPEPDMDYYDIALMSK